MSCPSWIPLPPPSPPDPSRLCQRESLKTGNRIIELFKMWIPRSYPRTLINLGWGKPAVFQKLPEGLWFRVRTENHQAQASSCDWHLKSIREHNSASSWLTILSPRVMPFLKGKKEWREGGKKGVGGEGREAGRKKGKEGKHKTKTLVRS